MDAIDLTCWATIIGAFILVVALTIGDVRKERRERGKRNRNG